jgi:hypothetical protein
VQGCRVVIDDPVPDLAIAIHDYLTWKGLSQCRYFAAEILSADRER